MADLLKNSVARANSYGAEDIEVLEGLEPVRRRPGMYIGGTDERALHHLVAELVDNSMDEAVAGHASRIDLALEDDGAVSVRDNGRGIPVDNHPKFPNKSALEVILTMLHSGGKFSGKLYETSGGLHGVGLSVVNALSDPLYVEIARDKQLWAQTYVKGLPQGKLKNIGPAINKRGTFIRFKPDLTIFGPGARFKPAILYRMARSKAYLFRGVEIRWSCAPSLITDDTPAEATLHFPGGLSDYLQTALEARPTVTAAPFAGQADLPQGAGRVEWAVSWPADGDDGFSQSYCNTIPTPDGGTHENGLRNALSRGIKSYGEMVNNRKAAQITPDDVMVSAAILLSVFIRDPQFQGQTKEKLASPEAARLVETVVKDHFDHWLTGDKISGNALLEALIARADERLKRAADRETARKTATRKLRLPGKLSDCSSSTSSDTEIFLVEGDSAGGSAKQARNRETQAILPLRGKILNVASASADKLRGNQELADLALALGCGLGKDCVVDKLRYDRVIIMTDADVDGAHIAALLMTFFYREMREIISSGHLFLAQPPLYRLAQGTKIVYARDDAHKDELMKTVFNNRKAEISRFKGLGEMQPAQLRETTMDPKRRTLLRVVLPDPHNLEERPLAQETEELVESLMGRKAESRFRFIQENAAFARDIDV